MQPPRIRYAAGVHVGSRSLTSGQHFRLARLGPGRLHSLRNKITACLFGTVQWGNTTEENQVLIEMVLCEHLTCTFPAFIVCFSSLFQNESIMGESVW